MVCYKRGIGCNGFGTYGQWANNGGTTGLPASSPFPGIGLGSVTTHVGTQAPFAPNTGWGGSIDELSVWNYAKYTSSPFSAQTSAYVGNETGLVSLYHFDGNPNDGSFVLSLTPTSGTGSTQTFAATYTDPNGTSDLQRVLLLFSTSIQPDHVCYLQYYPATNSIYLENDAGSGQTGPLTPGSSGSVSNSQCTVNGNGASVTTSGNSLTVTYAISFASAFIGTWNSYMYAEGASSTGWLQQGTWTVPPSAPSTVSLTPNSGSGLAQAFAAVYSDPAGASDLQIVYLLFNNTFNSGANACYVQYESATSSIYLNDDTGNPIPTAVAPGSSTNVSNSQCTLHGTGSSVSASGNNLTVTYNITFNTAFAGSWNSYMYAAGGSGVSDWHQLGTWGVPAILTSPSSSSGILLGSAGSSVTTVAFPGVSYQSPISLSASDYISRSGNDGIANAAAKCAALSPIQCQVDIPGSYSGTDSIAGFGLDIATADTSPYSSNTIIIDHRYGNQTYVSNNCADSFSNQCTAYTRQWVYYQPQLIGSPNVFAFLDKYTVTAGGRNFAGYLSNYQPEPKYGFFYTPGQSILGGVSLNKYATGDSLLHSEISLNYGGVSGLGTDEGNEWADLVVSQGTVEFQAPVTVGGASTHVITIGTPSQGASTLGEDRWVTDMNAVPYTMGSITGNACDTLHELPCMLNGASTNWPTSTAIGTINSAIPVPGPVTITPSFQGGVGSASNFSTTALACISDPLESEFLFPTSVTSTQITISPTRPHLSTAIITTGGLCGYVFEFSADEVTSNTYPPSLPVLAVTGTLHRVWMVVSTPSSTQMTVAVQAKGTYLGLAYNTSWNATTKPGYKLFKAAKVVAISTTPGSNSGIGGGQIVLGDNDIAWSTSSVLNEFLGAEPLNSFGFHTQNNYFANLAGGGLGFQFTGLFQGADTALDLNNATPTSFYDFNGGGYFVPNGIKLEGQYQSALNSQYGGRYVDISIGCPSNGCVSTSHPVLQIYDAAGKDYLYMQEVTGEWLLTTANSAFTYGFRKDGLEMPLGSSPSPASASGIGKLYLNSSYQVCVEDSEGVSHCASSGAASVVNGDRTRAAFPPTPVTLSGGPGVTSATCISTTCDLNAGSVEVAGGTFTSGAFLTIGYASAGLSVAPRVCLVSADGGSTYIGVGHAKPSTSSLIVTSSANISGLTVTLDYTCMK